MTSVWTSIAKKTCQELSEKGITVKFNKPDSRDLYIEARVNTKMYLAFARSAEKLWVELKLLEKKTGPQKDLYQQIKANRSEIESKFGYNITWDEDDRNDPGKSSDRKTYRIKSYIDSFSGSVKSCEKECIERMVRFRLALNSD